MRKKCNVLHYTNGDDGHWHALVESGPSDASENRNAAVDIAPMIDAIKAVSAAAKAEFESCFVREFNVGIHCWDNWSYIHTLPQDVTQSIADLRCSIAVTLYPMRHPDGSPR